MYAFVRFFEDDMCYALPVSNVEDFRPLHKTDFDNQKVYLVHRAEENGSTGQPCEAQILALAGKLPSWHICSARFFSLPPGPVRFLSGRGEPLCVKLGSVSKPVCFCPTCQDAISWNVTLNATAASSAGEPVS